MIRIFTVQFSGYFLKHIFVAVEPANSCTATLHLPSPRRSPPILGTINLRLPANRKMPVSRVVTNNSSSKCIFLPNFKRLGSSLFILGHLQTHLHPSLLLSYFLSCLSFFGTRLKICLFLESLAQ